MKRFHIYIGVEKLDEAIRFYSVLFGAEPVKRKPDYAKWSLEYPRVNFAISTRVKTKGMDHLGIQVKEEGELVELRERLKAGNMAVVEEGETVCCYARSDKSWVQVSSRHSMGGISDHGRCSGIHRSASGRKCML